MPNKQTPPRPMVKASEVKAFWSPKRAPVKKQCKTCPFGPNAHKLTDAAGAIEKAKASADMGLDFSCHNTVYKGAFTGKPKMQPQEKWKTCAGMVKYKHEREVEMRKAMLRAEGRLIEDQ